MAEQRAAAGDVKDFQEVDRKEVFTLLRQMCDILILIHRSPDGDCVGGGYALHLMLRALGVRSRVQCADPIPAIFDMITKDVRFEDFSPQYLVTVDVAGRSLLGDLPPQLKDAPIHLCIDHHISNTFYAEKIFWDPDSAAVSEMLYYMMRDNGVEITPEIATCLYIGMATDTGCFQFENAGADTFLAVSELKRKYPRLPYARINREMFVLRSKGRMTLDARLMQNVKISPSGAVALLYVPYDWIQELGVTQDELDGISNLPMQMKGVEIGITVKQQQSGDYRVSMRAGDNASVVGVCEQFGGGGHVKAGGCSISRGEPQSVCEALINAAEASLA